MCGSAPTKNQKNCRGEGMSGNRFELETWEDLKKWKEEDEGLFIHRFSDFKHFHRGRSMAVPQPSDFFILYRQTPCLIECKSSLKEPSFTTGMVKPHQIESLLNFERCGGVSYLLLNRRSNPKNQWCYAVRIQTYLWLLEEHGKTSTLRWDTIHEEIYKNGHGNATNRKNKTWNLKHLLEL
jgi:penicillin-binding protein-related factor A (putative recombinase)